MSVMMAELLKTTKPFLKQRKTIKEKQTILMKRKIRKKKARRKLKISPYCKKRLINIVSFLTNVQK
jgi:hypothetical protein